MYNVPLPVPYQSLDRLDSSRVSLWPGQGQRRRLILIVIDIVIATKAPGTKSSLRVTGQLVALVISSPRTAGQLVAKMKNLYQQTIPNIINHDQ